jgi:hypothetical protein
MDRIRIIYTYTLFLFLFNLGFNLYFIKTDFILGVNSIFILLYLVMFLWILNIKKN